MTSHYVRALCPDDERRKHDVDASVPHRSLVLPSSARTLLALQRQAGNQAVTQALAVQRNCEPGHHGPVNKAGVAVREMSNDEWLKSGQSTFLSVYLDNGGDTLQYLGRTRNYKSKTYGNEHAEDVAIRVLEDNWDDLDPGPNELILSVSKSPCTSTPRNGLPATSTKAEGCTEMLINLVTKGLTFQGVTKTFTLTLICRGLYQGTGLVAADALAASQEAVNDMAAAGIKVSGDVRPTSGAARYEVKPPS